MKNLQIIKVSFYHGANGAKVRLHDERLRERITIDYNYMFNSAIDVAIDYIKKIPGVNIIGIGDGDKGQYIVLGAGSNHLFKSIKNK